MTLTSANDAPPRDPASYLLEGSNDGTTFVTVSSGPVAPFTARFQTQYIPIPNSDAYSVYRLIFPTVADEGAANSMQIAEVELLGKPPGPVNGTVVLNGNIATYTPAPNYCGPDVFSYTATDPCGNVSAPAAVTIDVIGVPDAPACVPASAITCEDVAVDITLVASDPDIGSCLAEMLTFTVATPPANGGATIAGNVATYTPNANYNGADSFTFKVTDMYGLSSECNVSITVTPGNDTPVAVIEVSPLLDLGPTLTGWNMLSPNNIGVCAILDGTQSSDVDNDFEDLTFTWYVNGVAVGMGPVLENVCLLVGDNEITLMVDDNTGEPGECDEPAVGSTTEMVVVITGADACDEMILQIYESTIVSRKNKQQFIASLKTAAAAFERGSFGAAINKLEALMNKFEAQLKDDPEIQEAWMQRVMNIIDRASDPVDCEGCME
jgi:hypothetical protein